MTGSDRDARPSRRQFLAALGSGGAIGLAGCPSDGASGDATGTATNAATPSATPTPAPDDWTEGGPPDRDGWTVTFADDFSTGALDRSTWQSGFGEYPFDCPHFHGPDHCTVPENVAVADERLVLSATAKTPTIPEAERFEGRTDRPGYSVGAVNTDGRFEQEFGYFEAKCRPEAGPGTLPAFWLFLDRGEHDHREINVEFSSHESGRLVNFGVIWDRGGDGELERASTDYVLEDQADERFRVWGIEWGPEAVAFDVDGERVLTVDQPAVGEYLPGAELYVIVNHGVFDAATWVGDPAEAEFPLHHEVEWVRAWQHEAWG